MFMPEVGGLLQSLLALLLPHVLGGHALNIYLPTDYPIFVLPNGRDAIKAKDRF
jgi:hypothetical protein